MSVHPTNLEASLLKVSDKLRQRKGTSLKHKVPTKSLATLMLGPHYLHRVKDLLTSLSGAMHVKLGESAAKYYCLYFVFF